MNEDITTQVTARTSGITGVRLISAIMVVLNDTTPMIKTRVLYIGSAVPLDTAEGLDAVQGPLRERYPVDNETSIEGIDAHLSISNACIQLQYISDTDHVIQFPISSLTLCAAVRCVDTTNGASGEKVAKFVSLQDPLAGGENSKRPSIFTAITRRTQGRKVLECHGFICSNSREAMDLVKHAKVAGTNFKRNGSVATTPRPVSTTPRPAAKTVVTASVSNPERYQPINSTANRMSTRASTISKAPVQNGAVQNGHAMRLVPAEPVVQHIAAGPEFFEPVSTQGYFYSSNSAEVRKYNISFAGQEKKESPATPVNGTSVNGNEGSTVNGTPTPTPTQMNGHTPSPTPRAPPSRVTTASGPPNHASGPPNHAYGRYPGPPPGAPGPRPMFYGPPPPPQMFMRPRFFSPPPPRMRQFPYPGPPGGPMPMYAPPIYIRRPRPPSEEGSARSNSSDGSRSRSKTPTGEPGELNGDAALPTEARRIPNADESSDDSINRPHTPPTDYDKKKKKGGERMSRREAYEVRHGYARQPSPVRMMAPPEHQPHPYDYYVYPPRHGGFQPFAMYNPHGRSRSLPPDERRRSKSPKKKGKKHKKQKKSKKNRKHQERSKYEHAAPMPSHQYNKQYRQYHHAPSDVSTDSAAGYQSEIPVRKRDKDMLNGYTFYPPRDFRRDEKQFMNERNFAQSIARETRRSTTSRSYPTAYDINDQYDREVRSSRTDNNADEAEFNLY